MKNVFKSLSLIGCSFHKPPMLISILLLCGLFTTSSFAANVPEQISFQNMLENKDITMGEVYSIFQDSEGFMWLGGATGLFRYDGYEFRQIKFNSDEKSDKKDSVHFANNIVEDSHHNLWVSSKSGLLKYDSGKEKLIRIENDSSNKIKISTSGISDVVELPTGEILASSDIGLFVVDSSTYKYTTITVDPKKQNGLKSLRINSILLNGTDEIWLGAEEGLEKINWKTKTFTSYELPSAQPNVILGNQVTDIASDGEGKFWLATEHGVVHYDPKTRQAKRYVNDANDRYSLGSNDVWRVLLDSQGVLWTASDGGGISVFDKEKNRFINHKFEPGRPGSLNSSKARSVFEDNNGDMWVGNYPVGVNFYDRSSAAIITYTRDAANPNSLSHNAVLSVQEDKNGNLWVGTDGGGLNFLNRETGEFTHFKHDPNDPSTINGNAVLTTYIDSAGLIWVGVWGGGFASFNPVDKKFTRYPFDNQRKDTKKVSTSTSLNSAPVWSIREDKNHDLWLATHTGGISKYNRETKIFSHYTYIVNDHESLSSDLAWNTFEDSSENFWVGTSSGLNLFNREKESFMRLSKDPNDSTSLSYGSIISIFEDSKKRLWVGTDTGLHLFNPDTKKFTVYNKKSGFIDDSIRTIVEDSQGILWVNTNNGFASFNPETQKIKNYNRIGGRLVGGFATNSGIVSSRGEVIFGGTNGLRIFKPKELTENKNIPPIVLTGLTIFFDTVTVGGADGILKESINHTESITLDYMKSMFMFSFAALNFKDPAKNNYAYKLEGFDTDWQDAGNQRLAKYTNLNAGRYIFKVRGSNNDGVWNEAAKSITIIQLPPPWRTWWAYTLYTLTVFGLFGWFVISQRRKRHLIEHQHKILELKISERTAEVREKSKDIEAMLRNIPQGLFAVQDKGKIHPEYSHYMESIFETKNISGRDANQFLFDGANLGSDVLDSVKAAMFAIVGEDEMNFDFNKPLLINEYDIELGHKKKRLSLDWNPIIVNNVVKKLMVSVRDVTQLRQMESAAREQKRQLDIVSHLLNVSAHKYLDFEKSTTLYIQENRKAIQSCSLQDEKIVALLFRNMHTIKGNCRTLGFTYLNNTVHDVESIYSARSCSKNPSETFSGNANWEPSALLNDLALVEKGLAEYAHVYRAVLGRTSSERRERRGAFWLSNNVINKIRSCAKNRKVDELETCMSRLTAITLEQNLVDIIASLPSMTAELDKNIPVVKIAANNIFIKDSAQELIRDVFSHILRNCIDHGLESTEERIRAGKSEYGEIVISAKTMVENVDQKTLTISVQDDGRGLNIQALFKKGLQLGKWNEPDHPDISSIAELMFYSGVSTKEVVTNISGRGVGMDAVKQFLKEQGGGVSLMLNREHAKDDTFVPFKLIVSLPSHLFFEAETMTAGFDI